MNCKCIVVGRFDPDYTYAKQHNYAHNYEYRCFNCNKTWQQFIKDPAFEKWWNAVKSLALECKVIIDTDPMFHYGTFLSGCDIHDFLNEYIMLRVNNGES